MGLHKIDHRSFISRAQFFLVSLVVAMIRLPHSQGQISDDSASVAEALCLDCSIHVKRFWDGVALQQINAQSKQDQVVVAFSLATSLKEMETYGIQKAKSILSQYPFGRILIERSNRQKDLSFLLYHQFSTNGQGLSSLNPLESRPMFALDRHDPQDFYGFVNIGDLSSTIFLNNYQRPGYVKYTLTHELMHLFDQKSKDYIARMESQGRWHLIDSIALEARAVIGELKVFQEAKQAGREEGRFAGHLAQLLDRRGRIKDNEFEKYLFTMFFSKPGLAKKMFDEERSVLTTRVSGSYSTGYFYENLNEGEALSQLSFLKAIIRFIQINLSQRISGGIISFFSIPTKPILTHPAETDQQNLQQHLLNELKLRNADSLMVYLKNMGMFEDFEGEVKLSTQQINPYFHGNDLPSPRIGGGTLHTFEETPLRAGKVPKKLGPEDNGKLPRLDFKPRDLRTPEIKLTRPDGSPIIRTIDKK
jgi:hypothetical protein